MQTVIGWAHESVGSLKEFGVGYDELSMRDGRVDLDGIDRIVTAQTKMALVQRSRGYSEREPLSIEDIRTVSARIKAANPNCIVFVDNCYGEFVDRMEPTEVPTVDIIAGSLIKNPGGGLAPTGGYIAGRSDLVEAASYRLTAPGMGDELGASLVSSRLLYQGLFLAPHVVAQALKGAVFAAGIFEGIGCRTFPALLRMCAATSSGDRARRCRSYESICACDSGNVACGFVCRAGAVGYAGLCRSDHHGGGDIRAGGVDRAERGRADA